MNKSFIIFLIVWGIGFGICIHGLYDEMKINELSLGEMPISNYTQCDNLSLTDTAQCLVDYVSTFYNYTIRNDEIRTIEDIKINGGDCYDYNKLYERLGNNLNFETYSYRIYMGETAHRIVIITDETGYCLLDQLKKINCFKRKIDE